MTNINDVNDDCIIDIFRYLSTEDWMTLCSTTKRFREIVKNHVVRTAMIEISGSSSPDAVLNAFGNTMTKISFNLHRSHLEEFLQMLLDYCIPGLLTEIDLWYSQGLQTDQQLFGRTSKYLQNVKILKCNYVEDMNEWLTSFPSQQIISLDLLLDGTYDFRLNPESFPNLLKCKILIDSEKYPRSKYTQRFNAITEFVKRKSNLREFFYRYRRLEEQPIFEAVAENCLNIASLGIIKIKNNGKTSNWNFLTQCQRLETITIEFGVFDHRKFTDIFNILCSMRTLKVLHIHFENNREIPTEIICNDIVSFIKSNNGRRKIELLEHIEIFMDIDADVAQHLCHLVAITFHCKTMSLVIDQLEKDSKYLHSIVQNMHGLEHLSIEEYCLPAHVASVWSNLMMEKLSVNKQLRISKNLTIYVDKECEEKLKSQLGSLYDPQIIKIASHSTFPKKYNYTASSY